MYKIISILFFTIVITSCAVKGLTKRERSVEFDSTETAEVTAKARRINVTTEGFYIKKADIEIKTEERRDKFIGSVKYNKEGKYLISLKNITGIEAARIYLSGDTILINDRVNRHLYVGSSDYLKKNFGINRSTLSVIFGDFICTKQIKNEKVDFLTGFVGINCMVCSNKVIYYIDQKNGKITRIRFDGVKGNEKVDIIFNEFKIIGEIPVAQNIVIVDNIRNMEVTIKIKKMIIPWNDSILFIKGNRYELIELL